MGTSSTSTIRHITGSELPPRLAALLTPIAEAISHRENNRFSRDEIRCHVSQALQDLHHTVAMEAIAEAARQLAEHRLDRLIRADLEAPDS